MKFVVPRNVEELLQSMVRIDSVNAEASGNLLAEKELGDWLFAVAEAFGFECRRLPVRDRADNILVMHRANGAAKDASWLLFDSHLDTVAVEGMTIDPFGGEIRDGRLFGRGACDTKGTGAAMLWALKDYAAQADQPSSVAVLFSIDEETHMAGIRSFVANDLPVLRREGINFGGVFVGEPTYLRPVVAHNGIARCEVITHGKASHSAAPEYGRNAVSMMARAVTAIEQDYCAMLDATDPMTGKAVCTVTMINGGTQINIVPARCEISLDRRFVPGEDPHTLVPALRKVMRKLNVEFEIGEPHIAPPMPRSAAEPILDVVRRVLHEHGFDEPPIGAPFATHAGDLAAAGLPCVVLGPGDPTPAHTKDEWVSLADIREGVKVYEGLMKAKW